MANSKIERGSDRSFGIVFTIVFLVFALYPMINSGGINLWALVIATIFLSFALIRPKSLSFLNILWSKFGHALGEFMAPIVMFALYLLAVVPTGIIMKLFSRDLLNQKLNKKANSYWVKRDWPIGSMKNQF
jgi:hypothetical protein